MSRGLLSGRSLTSSSCAHGRRGAERSLRLSPVCAINNQHSHLEEEFVRLQQQLQAAPRPAKSSHAPHTPNNGHQHSHVIHDTEGHPFQPHRRHVHHGPEAVEHHRVHHGHEPVEHHHVHHAQHREDMQRNSHAQAQVQTHDPHLLHEDDFSAVEMSGQYSMGNIVAYRSMDPSSMPTEVLTVESLPLSHDDAPFPAPAYDMSYDSSGRPITPLPRPTVHRVRVSSYSHATPLAHDIEASLIRGDKLLLELPDEPSAVACLLSALGHASSKLQAAGLATALDPVYDTAAFLHGNGNGGGSGASSALSSMDQPGPRSSAASAHGNASNGSGGSPSASHDGHPACRRHVESGYSLCARAVPIPPPSAAPIAGYTVGTSIGQEVVRAGPSTNVHALLPALLRAILRDGLVTVRCNWIDEDIVLESWSDEDEAPGDFVTAAAAAATARQAASASAAPPRPQVPMPSPMDYPDGGDLVAAVTAAVAAQAAVTAAAAASAHTPTHIAHGHAHGSGSGGPSPLSSGSWSPTSSFERDLPAGSLVSVPCVLRAIFKLDRQLRGLDLGGLVVLPHSFSTRSARGSNAPMLHLDVVIA